MIVTILLSYEVKESVLRHQNVGMDVCFYHSFEQGGISLEEHLVFHDSRIVYDDTGSLRLAEKTSILTRSS